MTNKVGTENIVEDVAIKFGEWMSSIVLQYQRGGTYVVHTSLFDCSVTYTLKELFNIFINNYYDK